MGLSYTQFERALSSSGSMFEVVEVHRDGKTHYYRGRDVAAFFARQDHRQHEHKVYDPEGRLCYHRDHNGKVHIGESAQFRRALQQQLVGRAAVSQTERSRESRDRRR